MSLTTLHSRPRPPVPSPAGRGFLFASAPSGTRLTAFHNLMNRGDTSIPTHTRYRELEIHLD